MESRALHPEVPAARPLYYGDVHPAVGLLIVYDKYLFLTHPASLSPYFRARSTTQVLR